MWQTKYWTFKSWLTFTRGSSNLIFSSDLSFLYCSHLQSMSEPLYFGTLRKMSNCEIRRGCPWYKRLLDLADVFFLLTFKQIAAFINFNSIEDFLWVTFSCRKGRGRLLRKRGARPKTKPWDGRGMCKGLAKSLTHVLQNEGLWYESVDLFLPRWYLLCIPSNAVSGPFQLLLPAGLPGWRGEEKLQ